MMVYMAVEYFPEADRVLGVFDTIRKAAHIIKKTMGTVEGDFTHYPYASFYSITEFELNNPDHEEEYAVRESKDGTMEAVKFDIRRN